MEIRRVSMLTGLQHVRDINVTEEQLQKWYDGALIQNVMPHLSPEDREFIISGTTPEEWDDMFGGEE